MSREFEPTPRRARVLIAGTALLLTVGTVGSVLSLAEHYDREFLGMAKAQAAVATQHAKAVDTPAPDHAAGGAPHTGQG